MTPGEIKHMFKQFQDTHEENTYSTKPSLPSSCGLARSPRPISVARGPRLDVILRNVNRFGELSPWSMFGVVQFMFSSRTPYLGSKLVGKDHRKGNRNEGNWSPPFYLHLTPCVAILWGPARRCQVPKGLAWQRGSAPAKLDKHGTWLKAWGRLRPIHG